VVSLPARLKTKAVSSTAFRLEGVSGLRPVLWLGQPGAACAASKRITKSKDAFHPLPVFAFACDH
jgi:hypothetical protein